MEQLVSQMAPDDDSAALFAVHRHGGALCTVTHIEGSWSRRLGAQLAVLPDGLTAGSLADGCLERALAAAAGVATSPAVMRYGAGSPFVDIRLPCGSAIEVLVDPAPDRESMARVVAALARREAAGLAIGPTPRGHLTRHYLPRLRLIVLGSGPEVAALARLATALDVDVVVAAPKGEPACAAATVALSLGAAPALPRHLAPDPWTAIAVLFHDHEWERAILPWALTSPAFHVGAQGGEMARAKRLSDLAAQGVPAAALAHLRSPIGLFAGARTPSVLALSILAEVVAEYEKLVDAAAVGSDATIGHDEAGREKAKNCGCGQD